MNKLQYLVYKIKYGLISQYENNIKMRIANWIDKRYPKSCRANLVIWAKGSYTWKEMFNKYDGIWNNQICRKDNKDTLWAYCGKCEKNW